MKSLLYITDNTHEEKGFSKFILDALRDEYDVYELSCTLHTIDFNDHTLLEEKTFDVVLCWQVILPRNILNEKISFKKGILFPMHDSDLEIDPALLNEYNDFLTINLSKSMYLQCLELGIRSHYIQYFSKLTDNPDLSNQKFVFSKYHDDICKINTWIHEFCDNKKNILLDEEFFIAKICNNKNSLQHIIDHNKFHIYVLCKPNNALFIYDTIQKNNLNINIVTSKSQFEFIDAYLYSNLNNENIVINKKWISKYYIYDAVDIESIIKNIEDCKIHYPKITIVTVVHNIINNNRQNTLIKCFNSVHHQIYDGEIEHLVIDGGSTDGTLDILECYARKGWIKFFSEPDKGIYDAMNKGLAKASGEFIAYINSDDSYSNIFAIKCCIKSLITEKSDYCFGNTLTLSSDGTQKLSSGNVGMFPFGAHYCHQSMFVRTCIMRELGGFNLEYAIAADNDIMLQLYILQKKYTYVDLYYVKYQLGGWSEKNSHQFVMDHATAFYKWIGKNNGLTFEECLQMRNGKFANWNFDTFFSVFKRLSDAHISRAIAIRYFNIKNENIHVKATKYFFHKKLKYKFLSYFPTKSKKIYCDEYNNMRNTLSKAKITKIYLAGLIIMTKISFSNIIFFNLIRNIPLLAIRHDKNVSIYIFGIKIFLMKTRN